MAKKVYIGAENFPKIELPAGYTQLEYIESSGTQYIDTGFQPNQDTRVVCDIEVTQISGYAPLFGARKAVKNMDFSTWAIDETRAQDGYGSNYDSSIAINLIGRNVIDKNKNVYIVNGTTLYTHSAYTFQTAYPLYIFNINTSGSKTGSYTTYAKLYSCKIYDNGTLVRDFVPCKNSSNEIGLYDLVNSVFYANAGSGTFTAGTDYAENVAMNVEDIYLGVSSVARNITNGYVGQNGVARQFWTKGGKALGTLSVGRSVFMNVNGVSTEFIVVQQGLPSSDYDNSCDGTWLLMKDVYVTRAWDSTNNDYANSDIHSYLNNTFVNLFDSDIKGAIKQIKLPYTVSTGRLGTLLLGSSGISSRVFLLSYTEVGFSGSSYANTEGAVLDYFDGAANSDRIGYFENTATAWWLRSPNTVNGDNGTVATWNVTTSGSSSHGSIAGSRGVRPCLILPSDTGIDSNYNVTPPLPTTLGELNAGDTVYMNVNGISTEFIVVNQGLPSNVYDSSCDGTWLLMKDIYENSVWGSNATNYSQAAIYSYLNDSFISLFDYDVKNAIKQVKVPYASTGSTSATIYSGTNGLTAKVFLLSHAEVGYSANNYSPMEGSTLSYFNSADNSKRIGYQNGAASMWWLRTPYNTYGVYACCVDTSGNSVGTMINQSKGIRPALILPSTTGINESFTVTPPPVTVNTLSVGDTVKIKVNGVATEFIIVHKGRPSTAYDSSCNGVWVLMKDLYESRAWDSYNNDYANSDIHSYLNSTFVNLFDSDIKSVIKQVKLPYTKGTGSGGSLASGSSGFSAKVFLLSYTELGYSGNSSVNVEGSVLSYFNDAADSKRIAKLNGTAANWWLRSPDTDTTDGVWRVRSTGSNGRYSVTNSHGVRPALVLPTTAVIDENNNIIG